MELDVTTDAWNLNVTEKSPCTRSVTNEKVSDSQLYSLPTEKVVSPDGISLAMSEARLIGCGGLTSMFVHVKRTWAQCVL